MLLIAAALFAGLSYLVWLDIKPMLDRLIVVYEQRHAAPVQTKPSEPMPADLHALADRQDSEWARDETKAAMQEAYHELGDWTMVRARYQGVFQ